MATITHQASVLPSVPISGGGTQSNEFNAAIKSVTSSTTVGAVFLYDTSQDSDGGAWRKKCKGLSWFDEGSSTTRSARSEFPAMALIVADNAASATVTIYDLDDPAMPMWMVFNVSNTTWLKHYASSAEVSSATMLNGRLITGGGGNGRRLSIVSFPDDNGNVSEPSYNYEHFGIINRQGAVGPATGPISIVNINVNDVAATVLEGAEIGALGLPIPTVAVATDGGVSVIHPSGDVYDQTYQYAINDDAFDIFWDKSGGLYWSTRDVSDAGTYVNYLNSVLFADSSAAVTNTYEPSYGLVPFLANTAPYVSALTLTSDPDWAVGSAIGLTLYKQNKGNPAEGAVAYITSAYNTGYMVGDIRFAGLAGSMTADRSVKANTLTRVGTGTAAADVATDAELQAYTGFGSSSYFSISDTNLGSDLDFGTGDFSIMFWCKFSSYSGTQRICGRADSSSSHRLSVYVDTSYLYLYTTNGSAVYAYATKPTADEWTQVAMTRRSNALKVYLNGSDQTSTSGSGAVDLTCTSASPLVVGAESFDQGSTINSPATNGSLSLLRISATAPTPQQIKEIYEAEKVLFRSGAKCLLQSDHSTQPNNVLDLSHDKSTDLLSVSQFATASGSGVSVFRGLEMVDASLKGTDYGWDGNSTALVATGGGVSAITRNATTGGDDRGVVVDLPSIDVRAELNEGESKIPDDGKLHFSGVTVNATPTIIGQIPISENEEYFVTAKVSGHRYNPSNTTSHRIVAEIKQPFIRPFGLNVGAEAVTSKLIETENADLDVVLDDDNPPQTVRVKVTGDDVHRMQWTAEVEVQRISDKTYER